mmetsp:Transcript_49433/g.159566  ORF Transcript_49433/g.159566 Transcript_49433/m.159566 type:complete len:255 (-) Transcript_49433:457-1221(-)
MQMVTSWPAQGVHGVSVQVEEARRSLGWVQLQPHSPLPRSPRGAQPRWLQHLPNLRCSGHLVSRQLGMSQQGWHRWVRTGRGATAAAAVVGSGKTKHHPSIGTKLLLVVTMLPLEPLLEVALQHPRRSAAWAPSTSGAPRTSPRRAPTASWTTLTTSCGRRRSIRQPSEAQPCRRIPTDPSRTASLPATPEAASIGCRAACATSLCRPRQRRRRRGDRRRRCWAARGAGAAWRAANPRMRWTTCAELGRGRRGR